MKPKGDTFTKSPTGHIEVNGRSMAFWLPDGVDIDDIGIEDVPPVDRSDSGPDADDSVNDLVDEVPR